MQPILRVGGSEIFVKREDRIFFSQGTKIRKLKGIYESLKSISDSESRFRAVLRGNLHSNAILSGVLFFHWMGISVKVEAYSRNPELESPASILARRFSEISLYSSRREWEEQTAKIPAFDFSGGPIGRSGGEKFGKEILSGSSEVRLPEYLFCSPAFHGLSSLWEEIDPRDFDWLVLDVGSGLTWLSALRWNQIPVLGISLGLSFPRMKDWILRNTENIGFPDSDLRWSSLFDPRSQFGEKSFAFRSGKKWKSLAEKFSTRTGIFIEPVYAAKSLFVIEELVKAKELKGRILYVYQGGILQSLSLLGKE
ncbi:1-aminocyclopropane-1-carboxylate deaminase [Leptospira fletcheri]|uniref:1-aminocyclopropane-1-carboxylate deaminase n=1 Tax=Leptospira fletcheri TaxID=2484981 RepID=A0A4R9GM31_9LEPT|nr:1-aminocyclopropane-1-carboxylate deaminase [Leptospira fletcheri]